MAGKKILYAQNGFEAVLTCIANPDIDLILMDIKMPEMDGIEATRQIRQTNKEVIIIVQSEFTDSGEREKAEEAGCNDFLTKPINKILLEEIIKKHYKNRKLTPYQRFFVKILYAIKWSIAQDLIETMI